MGQLERVLQKAQETIRQMLKDPEKYIEFLNTAANNYSYSFLNQVLIYANRPDAKAVATYEDWNERYERYVKKGARSFCILDSRDSVTGVKRVIDYSDTNNRKNEEVYFWQMNEENRSALQAILSDHGYLFPENEEIRVLTNKAMEAVAKYKTGSIKDGDKLYGYVRESIYVLLLARTDPEKFQEMSDCINIAEFDYIRELEPASMRLIGNMIKAYVYNIFDELRSKDTEIRNEIANARNTDESSASETTIDEEHVRGEHIPEKQNYTITDNSLGRGSSKEKYRRNINAVKLLKQIESEGRMAKESEKEILSQYVGWGGLAEAFDNTNIAWGNEYQELKGILSPDEYKNAKESVLSAFYTQPVIINAIYKALENYGFVEGNILEPACGTGNFFGMLPAKMNASRLYGVEIDKITARIAQQLYQNANIIIDGYENTAFPDEFFDVAVGNVPFGQYGVSDQRYDKYHFLIHDYYFAKTLDKVRKGGIIAFITSKGTLDKKRNEVRKYIAEQAEFLGAIRLPSDAFKGNAGTETVADIIFLKKRETPIEYNALSDTEKEWTYIGLNKEGIPMNEYFIKNPDMIMGIPQMVSGRFGPALDIKAKKDEPLETQLIYAIGNLSKYTIAEKEAELEIKAGIQNGVVGEDTIPARPDVRNNSYTIINNEVYYRQNEVMVKVTDKPESAMWKIKQMIIIRDQLRKVIDLQVKNAADEEIKAAQTELNRVYEDFYSHFGSINNRSNMRHFEDDSSCLLISTLEKLDEQGKVIGKSDIFCKRTISPDIKIEHVESAEEALIICYREKGAVDMAYMSHITDKSEEELIRDLRGQIYPLPGSEYEDEERRKKTFVFQLASEYLSGNVREKLREANRYLEKNNSMALFEQNRIALEEVQPKDLDPSEIEARLGASWIPVEYYTQFLHEIMELSGYKCGYIFVMYEPLSNLWMISGKNLDLYSINSTKIWGTERKNAYEIMEACLNQRTVEVTDTVEDIDGRKKQVKNPEETMKAQEKQSRFKEAFTNWIWEDYERREHLTRLYNEKFNSVVPRKFDGRYVKLTNYNREIKLRPHQLDAIAHALYGGNTLFDHAVGAGKTFEMIATAMESKRLGFCTKPVIAVPNHLTMQVGQDFLRMYPGANVLIADKKSFQKNNRKRFCSRIATGEWDCIIMAHSQLEKIPLSKERQEKYLQDEIETYEIAVKEEKRKQNGSLSVKVLEASKKALEVRLRRLQDDAEKDDVVTFEELGVDKLLVDEAHEFKNLAFPTRMSGISGVSGAKSKKATDLYLKTKYLNEKTNFTGVTFATGTPISNSLWELFVMQKYLQENRLQEMGIHYFDSWAAVFGNVETTFELKPEGTGYQMKSRFCKYQNIPELLRMFHEIADVKTAEMLNIPVPEVEEINVTSKKTEFQREFIAALGDRAEEIRSGNVPSDIDNMLVVTNEGRKVALDQRLIDSSTPDEPDSKVNICIENLYGIYKETENRRLTQIVFCDLSTPHKDGSFNVYTDIKQKLVAKGVKESEIAFIQDAGSGTNADKKKEEIFTQVREGKIRILIGSTAMMGTGANIQNRLYALHHLDCPWRPSDMEQRAGRIRRFGNLNEKVKIYKYITQGTFDAYMFQILELKQRFISQIQNGTAGRTCNVEEDKAALNYAETKALCTENPLIKEKMDLDMSVARLRRLAGQHKNECYMIERRVRKELPEQIQEYKKRIQDMTSDMITAQNNTVKETDCQVVKIKGQVYDNDTAATKELIRIAHNMDKNTRIEVGEYRGFQIELSYSLFHEDYQLSLLGKSRMVVRLGLISALKKLDHEISALPERINKVQEMLAQAETDLENGQKKINLPFVHEEELLQKSARLKEVDKILEQINSGEQEMECAAQGKTFAGERNGRRIMEPCYSEAVERKGERRESREKER